MSNEFYSIVTDFGAQKQINCLLNGSGFDIKYLAVGDGNGNYYTPQSSQTQLVKEKWRGPVSSCEQIGNKLYAVAYIPSTVGGFTIREAGIFDTLGNLLVVGRFPETVKQSPDSGTIKELTIKVEMGLVNTDIFSLIVNPNVSTATTVYVDSVALTKADGISYTDNKLQLKSGEELIGNEVIIEQVDLTPILDNLTQKANLDLGNVSLFDVIDLGTITSNFTLTKDRIHKGAITASCTLILPAVSAKFHNVLIDFTLASGASLTIPTNVFWNYSITPALSNTLVNRFIFDTKDGGTTWKGYYSQFAGAL